MDERRAGGAALLLWSLVVLTAATAPALSYQGNGAGAAQSSILIEAPPSVVWEAIHKERFQDPDLEYTRVLRRNGNSMLLEEKFVSVPVVGCVRAVLSQQEQPFNRIDYRLVDSDKFKRLEGSWSLSALDGGKRTLLKLSSFLDVGVPFSGPFIRAASERKIKKRLSNVKGMAESQQAKVAAGDAQTVE